MIGFSPWAIENLRFDETIGGVLHGYDFDICMQARTAGRKVVTTNLRVVHNHSLELISGVETWVQAHMTLAEKWHDELPVSSTDWEMRGRRAEAELSVTNLIAGVSELLWNQRVKTLEAEVASIKTSLSWRLATPLRLLSAIWSRLDGRGPRLGPVRAAQSESPSTRSISSRENAGAPR